MRTVVIVGLASGFATYLRMMLIWLVHASGRCETTMQEFFVKLRWSLEALQSGRFPKKAWDGGRYMHHKVTSYLMGTSIDIDIDIDIDIAFWSSAEGENA